MSEKDTNLIAVTLSRGQIISALKNMPDQERESFIEDLLAATRPEYLEHIREARAHYGAGLVQDTASAVTRFPVTLYQDEEGWYVAECPIIPGCLSQGRTEDEALHNVREAIQLCLEVRHEQGLPATIQSREVEIPTRA
jgi:predicted RNase H-like HicB family nuclease